MLVIFVVFAPVNVLGLNIINHKCTNYKFIRPTSVQVRLDGKFFSVLNKNPFLVSAESTFLTFSFFFLSTCN